MAVTRWPDVVTALVSLMQATTGYRAPEAYGLGCPVYDGPVFTGTGHMGSDPELLLVGWAPSDESGVTRQEPFAVAANTRPRDEEGQVACQVIVNSGDDLATVRARAFEILGDVETLTRTNPDLGLGSASGFRWAKCPGQVRITQTAHTQGYTVQLDFDVTYKARLP